MIDSRFRSALRIGMVLAALLLVFDGGFLSPITRQLSDTTYEYLAAAGASMSAGVPENEFNRLSADIRAEQLRLAEREEALVEREIAARTYATSDGPDYSTYIISLLLFIILVLLLLNYVLDWQRARMAYPYQHKQAT
jgi:hypothetical protein